MKGLIRSQVHDDGVVALSPKSVILVTQRGRERASINYNFYASHFCCRLFIVLEREFQEMKVSKI